MATNTEIRIVLNNNLYALLLLRAENKKVGIEVRGLSKLLSQAKASMTKEDIAWVEQQIAELKEEDL